MSSAFSLSSSALDDDARTLSVLYRRAESDAFHQGDVDARMRAALADDPALDAQVQEAWLRVQSRLAEAFQRLVPSTQRDRKAGKGPLQYEFHHTASVARQSFLLALSRHDAPHTPTDVEAAERFTLRRLGLDGDPQAFFDSQRAALLPASQDIA